jgi:hypothetical protein
MPLLIRRLSKDLTRGGSVGWAHAAARTVFLPQLLALEVCWVGTTNFST